MKIAICAVGRLRTGPERDLIDNYIQRLNRTGRALGVGPAEIFEVEDKKGGGMAAEAALLERMIPSGATIVVMDERGQVLPSPKFAQKIANWRDDGCQTLAFVIGGADGISPELRAKADFKLSFGAMVWPHMLARVMLCEQLYRASTILAGGPYHRN